MLTWQFSPFQHQFKIPPLLFSPGQRSTFSDYASVKSCQHLPESPVENKENSRADGKRWNLSKVAVLAHCRNQERDECHNWQEAEQFLSCRIQGIYSWQATTQPCGGTDCLQLLLSEFPDCSSILFSVSFHNSAPWLEICLSHLSELILAQLCAAMWPCFILTIYDLFYFLGRMIMCLENCFG